MAKKVIILIAAPYSYEVHKYGKKDNSNNSSFFPGFFEENQHMWNVAQKI